jgi:lipoyl(octanoyl) transferase
MQNKKTFYQDLGFIDYQKAWDFQENIFNGIVSQKVLNREKDISENVATNNYIFTCEHPHVYTLGKSGKKENLLINNNELKNWEATFYKINRGGDITYHGPGQLVIYPIIDLDNFFTDIHKYLRFLEEAVINTLEYYGIISGRIEGLTGVWIGIDSPNPRKICAMGVRSSRWVVMHGLALNVNTELDYFNNIIPCGIADKEVTSIKYELKQNIDMNQVKEKLIENIANLFGMELIFGLSTSKV